MKALRLDKRVALVEDVPIPRRNGEALVEVICAGICNTDLEIVKGYAGFRGTLGHEFVGRVAESPDASLVGKRVVGEINAGCGRCGLCQAGDPRHCSARTVLGIKNRDGAFAEFLSLPDRNLVAVPDWIGDEAAVFAEPLAAALNILEQVDIDSSSRVAIVGDGKLAQLIVLAVAGAGCDLTVIGRHQDKLALARKFGARSTLLESAGTISNLSQRFDVCVEASGSPSGLEAALAVVRPRGTVVLKSTHHGLSPVDTSPIVINELKLIGSRCGRIETAIEYLSTRKIDLTSLISKRLRLDEGVLGLEVAAAPDTLKVILQMR